MTSDGQTVCLNMIVKNEAPVIARCLASVRPLIDSWVIVDTGSTDGDRPNTFSREHHLHITTCTGANERIEQMSDKIREAVHYYPVPKPIPVLGASGPVFIVG